MAYDGNIIDRDGGVLSAPLRGSDTDRTKGQYIVSTDDIGDKSLQKTQEFLNTKFSEGKRLANGVWVENICNASVDTTNNLIKVQDSVTKEYYYVNATKLEKPATPTFGVGSIMYSTTKTVKVYPTCSTSDVILRYTVNGGTPTAESQQVPSTGIIVCSTALAQEYVKANPIKVVAFKNGLASDVATLDTTIYRKLTTPTISANNGDYDTSRTVTITNSNSEGTISYKEGTGSYGTYSNAFDINSTTKITAKVTADEWVDSDEVSDNYTVGKLAMWWGVVTTVPTTDSDVTSLANRKDQDKLPATGTLPINCTGKTFVFACKKAITVSEIWMGGFKYNKQDSTTTSYNIYYIDNLASTAAGLTFEIK